VKRFVLFLLIVAVTFGGILLPSSCAQRSSTESSGGTGSTAAEDRILVLYDSAGAFGSVGEDHAIMLANLLGHFDMTVSWKPVTRYVRGEMETRAATFYLGSTFNEQSYYDPDSNAWLRYNHFLADSAETSETLVWINYNLHLLQQMMAGGVGQNFTDKYGFSVTGVVDNLYNRIGYKDTELYKGVVPFANPGATLTGCVEEGDNVYACATELSAVEILNPYRATVYARAYSTLTPAEPVPYITRSGNFWFVGDLPFSHMSEEDRYLAFADILHDMLNVRHNETHRALVRLEDVSAASKVEDLTEISEYLIQNSIPFSVSVIAQYREGNTNGQDLWLSETGQDLQGLHLAGHASIIAHGYTHQRDALDNPYNGVSSYDFEFFRVTMNGDNSLNFEGPIEPDTQVDSRNRMQTAISILNQAGLQPFAWEAPHYIASENSYLGILPLFPIHYGRMMYFNYSGNATLRMVGQFFPYVIHEDIYGYCVIPENLGNIVPAPVEGYRQLFPEDLIRQARKALVVRDGFASFFYHPFLGEEYLRQIVEGVQDLGYNFVAADELN